MAIQHTKPAHVSQRAWDNCQPGEKKVISERAAETPEQRLARKRATIKRTCEMLGQDFDTQWTYFCKTAGILNA